ncbi:unnamed protein product [Echinostoma caproni]|uniref:Zinc finger protein n=1 Tax=Echinostoma caproni TaxID=27848 RepID=A0A183BAI4_9TREM|nr:unnamed protein product [Echinostoma caproni]
MLHRPSLIPSAMKMAFKSAHNDQTSIESDPGLDLLLHDDDEIIVVEPTDPDEDRLREQEQQEQQQQQQLSYAPHMSPKQTKIVCSSPSIPHSSVEGSFRVDPAADSGNSDISTDNHFNGLAQSHPNNAINSGISIQNLFAPIKLTTFPIGSVPTLTSNLASVQVVKCIDLHNLTRTTLGSQDVTSQLTTSSTDSHSTISAIIPIGNLNTVLPALLSSNPVAANVITNLLSAIFQNSGPNTTTATIVNASGNTATAPSTNPVLSSVQTTSPDIKTTSDDVSPPKPPSRAKRFTCPMVPCPLTFANRFNLTEHIRTHTGERPFVCNVGTCTAAFNRHRSLRDHMKVHKLREVPRTSAHSYASSIESRVEHDADDLSSSNEKLPSEDVNTSSTDPAIKLKVDEEDFHAENTHQEEQSFARGCMKQDVESSDSAYPCLKKEEYKLFPTSRPELIRRFSCPYKNCNKVFLKANRMREHARTHTGERPYSCPFPGCVATFGRAYGVRRHMQSHALGLRHPIRWTRAAPEFSNPPTSGESSAGSTPIPIAPAVSAADIARRRRMPFPYDFVPTTTATSIAQSTCLRNPPVIAPKTDKPQTIRPLDPLPIGPGILRPHSCPFRDCAKTFAKMYQLRDHIWSHTGRRPFACGQCRASFVRLYDLRRHEKIHSRFLEARCDSISDTPCEPGT